MGKPAKDMFDPKVFLAKVGMGKTILEYQKNQVIFAQGEIADSVFYVQIGRVKVTVLSEEGKEAVVGSLEPGQFFGEGCLNGHPLRIATTMAMDDCVITSITKHAMIAVLHDEPKFSELERKATGAPAAVARQFRKGWPAATCTCGDQSGNTGGDDRHDPIPREFFHEQISETGLDRL